MNGASTQRSFPSRATLLSCRQTHLSALCLLHDRGNVQTLSGAYSCLYSHRFGTPTCRDLVHTRTPQGYWEGIHSHLRTRSVAFPDHSQRALQRLREHVAQDQERGQWVAEWCGRVMWATIPWNVNDTWTITETKRGSKWTRKRSRKIPDCVRWPRCC